MKTTYTLPIRLSEDMARKLVVLAEAEGRTPEAQFILMLRNAVSYHERAKGKLDPIRLKQADLSVFVQNDKTV